MEPLVFLLQALKQRVVPELSSIAQNSVSCRAGVCGPKSSPQHATAHVSQQRAFPKHRESRSWEGGYGEGESGDEEGEVRVEERKLGMEEGGDGGGCGWRKRGWDGEGEAGNGERRLGMEKRWLEMESGQSCLHLSFEEKPG